MVKLLFLLFFFAGWPLETLHSQTLNNIETRLYKPEPKEWHEYNSKEILGPECLNKMILNFTKEHVYVKECIEKKLVTSKYTWKVTRSTARDFYLELNNSTVSKRYIIYFGKQNNLETLMLREFSDNPAEPTKSFEFKPIK